VAVHDSQLRCLDDKIVVYVKYKLGQVDVDSRVEDKNWQRLDLDVGRVVAVDWAVYGSRMGRLHWNLASHTMRYEHCGFQLADRQA
jgi:hypothetical protein